MKPDHFLHVANNTNLVCVLKCLFIQKIQITISLRDLLPFIYTSYDMLSRVIIEHKGLMETHCKLISIQ